MHVRGLTFPARNALHEHALRFVDQDGHETEKANSLGARAPCVRIAELDSLRQRQLS